MSARRHAGISDGTKGYRARHAPRYMIEISKQDVSYNSEDGEPLDGDRRMIRDHGTDVRVFGDAFDQDEGNWAPVTWATEVISQTDAYEPSVYPIPAELPEHAWLSGSYEHPYLDQTEETSVRLTGAWTPAERAEVFRAVYGRVFPAAAKRM